MSDYMSYLTGKRVALVGPADTLRGTGMGRLIDAHDVVVRINHAWPVPKGLKEDIGSSVDIIYHNLNPRNQLISRSEVLKMHRDGVRWLVSTHPNHRLRFRRRQRRFRRVNRGLLKFRIIPASLKRRLLQKVRTPNGGLVAIVDLLRFPIQSLYVTGFSFYTSGYLKYPNYRSSFAKKAVSHHNQAHNKSFLAHLLTEEKRLQVDLMIADLLEEHMNKRRGARKT